MTQEFIEIPSHFDKEKKLRVKQAELDQQSAEWDRIMKLAEKAGLVVAAAGGVAMLYHPNVQLKEGIYHKTQWMTGNTHRCEEVEAKKVK